jgi:hypothetical protein
MVLRSTLLIGVLLVLLVFLSARIYSVFAAKWIALRVAALQSLQKKARVAAGLRNL